MESETLTESEAAAVLAFLEQQRQLQAHGRWPPSFAGVGHSGTSDLGARSEEILQAEFGSR